MPARRSGRKLPPLALAERGARHQLGASAAAEFPCDGVGLPSNARWNDLNHDPERPAGLIRGSTGVRVQAEERSTATAPATSGKSHANAASGGANFAQESVDRGAQRAGLAVEFARVGEH